MTKLSGQMADLSVRTQMIAFGIGSILVTTAALCLIMIWQSQSFSANVSNDVDELVNASLKNVANGVYGIVNAQDELLRQMVEHDLNVARRMAEDMGGFRLSNETVTWSAVDQFSNEEQSIVLPRMWIGDSWLAPNGDFSKETPLVDEVTRQVEATVTVFQRMNDGGDMLRVATTVEKLDGTRAIGTYIPAINPDGSANSVVSAVLAGDTYRGVAYVVNAWYVTAYEPIFDAQGEVIGVLYVGVKQESVESLRHAIQQIVVGKTGHVYILGAQGDDRGHFIVSPNGSQDGEDIWTEPDAEGNYYVQEIVEKAVALGPQEYATVRYLWQEDDNIPSRWKSVHLAYYAPWDWIIAVSAYEEDFQESYQSLAQGRADMLLISVIAGALLLVLGSLLTWLYAKRLTQPLVDMLEVAERLAEGDIQQQVLFHSRNEIGRLAEGFRRIIGYQQEMAVAATNLATGNLAVQVAPQSDKDRLGNAFQQMVGYQQEMAAAAAQLSTGDLNVQVSPKSDEDVLGNAFHRMVTYQQDIAGAVGQVARGNLAINVEPLSDQDALGNAVQKMIGHLRSTVGSVQSNARLLLASSRQLSTVSDQAGDATRQITMTIEQMAGTTQQVAQTIGQVAVGAAQQAEVMERTRFIVDDQEKVITRISSGSVQQTHSIEAADQVFRGRLSAAIQQVETATIASDAAVSSAVQAAHSGTQAVTKTIAGINSVAKTADQVTHRISEMGKRSHQIGAIVQVINEIAERTNLLSLNAAIEAARAGEHGKGFAVVADEVRKLADRSAKSAEEISQLVSTVQEAANQAVAAMEENDRQVRQGLETAGDAESALAGIRSAMSQVGEQMGRLQGSVADLSESSQKVQAAMQQVAGVIEENMDATAALTASHMPIQQSMEEIASVAEENSAAAEEVAASAEENSASVEEISAMTKSVNAQVAEVAAAVQSLSTMATELESIAASFQLARNESMPQPSDVEIASAVRNGKQALLTMAAGNGWR